MRVPIRYRRGAELELVIGPNGERTVVPRGQRDLVTVRAIKYPTEVQGPIPYGTGSAWPRCSRTATGSRRCR